jgi:hypothetical protein
MCNNRLTTHFGGALPEGEAYGAFYVVSGPFGSLMVTAATARAIERELERRKPPRWLVFRDRSGSHLRIRTRDLRSICESTPAQRAYDRRMARLREREEQGDYRSFDDD